MSDKDGKEGGSMFFRERCSLCGGKLDSNNICTECGLDNNKSEKHYHVNQSSCD